MFDKKAALSKAGFDDFKKSVDELISQEGEATSDWMTAAIADYNNGFFWWDGSSDSLSEIMTSRILPACESFRSHGKEELANTLLNVAETLECEED